MLTDTGSHLPLAFPGCHSGIYLVLGQSSWVYLQSSILERYREQGFPSSPMGLEIKNRVKPSLALLNHRPVTKLKRAGETAAELQPQIVRASDLPDVGCLCIHQMGFDPRPPSSPCVCCASRHSHVPQLALPHVSHREDEERGACRHPHISKVVLSGSASVPSLSWQFLLKKLKTKKKRWWQL